MANLLDNYIAMKPTIQPAKPMPDFDIKKELDNRTFIKPLKGKGKLLDENPLTLPQSFISDITYNAKAFKHAIKGEANDHELGKLNDVGLMGGMLAIAGYLSGLRSTPLTKGMEFIGPLAFLASMTLWPKIAIQLPAYLIHGVNVQKQYQDSFGRTKPFYQDPQFIPWDLYSDEQIQKIGNRMGVPKNIPNRRDFIQEKMRKLAIQNNTLWMMTAGFATPVMASLMCNGIQPYYLKYLDNAQNAKANKMITKIDKYSKNSNEVLNKIQKLKDKYNGKPISKELFKELAAIFTEDMDAVTSESLKKDLKELLFENKYSINETTSTNISKNIAEQLASKGFEKGFISAIVPNKDEMTQLFKDNDLFKVSSTEDMQNIIKKVLIEINKRVQIYNNSNPSLSEDANLVRSAILSVKKEKNPILKELFAQNANVFDSALQEKLIDTAKIFDEFNSQRAVLDKYALIKVGSAPETVIANYWNDTSSNMLKIFGFTDKEIEKVRFSSDLMGKLLREKIETIVSDRSSYEKAMKSILDKISEINEKINTGDITSHTLTGNNGEKTVYEKAVDTVYDGYAQKIKSKGFSRTAEALAGSNNDAFGTAKAIQKAYAEERLLGVKSSFYRLINTLDFFRRAATNPNDMKPFNKITREVKEELIELCKIISLEGHSSDHATKFYMMRNPNPSDDMSEIEVVNGRIKYKYFGQNVGKTDIPGDKYFYQNGMQFMFGEELHPETRALIERSGIKDEIINYRNIVMDKLGSEKYFFKPRHRVRNAGEAGSDVKFLLTGISPNELFFKTGQQVFNTKKWLKMFGGFGIGLLGATVFLQFFLGRLKAGKDD